MPNIKTPKKEAKITVINKSNNKEMMKSQIQKYIIKEKKEWPNNRKKDKLDTITKVQKQ